MDELTDFVLAQLIQLLESSIEDQRQIANLESRVETLEKALEGLRNT